MLHNSDEDSVLQPRRSKRRNQSSDQEEILPRRSKRRDQSSDQEEILPRRSKRRDHSSSEEEEEEEEEAPRRSSRTRNHDLKEATYDQRRPRSRKVYQLRNDPKIDYSVFYMPKNIEIQEKNDKEHPYIRYRPGVYRPNDQVIAFNSTDESDSRPKSPHKQARKILNHIMKSPSKPKSMLADIDPLNIEKVDFKSIGGLDGHIEKLKEMILMPLLYPEIFKDFGIKPPRYFLLNI